MSTRAMYTFKDHQEAHHVYKHFDGYPEGAAEAIRKALAHSWKLPRFEPDEFAAGFVAANKDGEGNIRLMLSGDWKDVAPLDLAYRYEVTAQGAVLCVTCYDVDSGDWNNPEWSQTELYSGPLEGFELWAKKQAAA